MSRNETNSGPNSSAGASLARACAAVVVFYAALLLLNGKGIHDKMSKLEYGRERDILMAAAAPFKAVAENTRLCALRDASSRLAGAWLNRSH